MALALEVTVETLMGSIYNVLIVSEAGRFKAAGFRDGSGYGKADAEYCASQLRKVLGI